MTLVPFSNADDIADRFLALLSNLGISPPPGSAIEDELLSTRRLVEVMKQPNLARGPDQHRVVRHAAGLHDFAAKVLATETLPEFEQLRPHLMLLGREARPFDTAVQNSKASPANDTNRKLTELYLACLAIHLGTEIELDSPTRAVGDNPDIIFRPSDDPARRWALAIKSVSGQSGQTYFERICEATKQIDAPACSANAGIVVVNAKDALDHETLWANVFPDERAATEALQAQLQDLIDKAVWNRPQSEWDALFQGKVVRPILFLGQSVARIDTCASSETPTALKTICMFGANGQTDPKAYSIAFLMNHFMQTILCGIPGSVGRQPS